MKIAGKLIEVLISVFLAAALLPIIITTILGANLTGLYKTIWSVTAIVVVVAVLYMILKSLGVGGSR